MYVFVDSRSALAVAVGRLRSENGGGSKEKFVSKLYFLPNEMLPPIVCEKDAAERMYHLQQSASGSNFEDTRGRRRRESWSFPRDL